MVQSSTFETYTERVSDLKKRRKLSRAALSSIGDTSTRNALASRGLQLDSDLTVRSVISMVPNVNLYDWY